MARSQDSVLQTSPEPQPAPASARRLPVMIGLGFLSILVLGLGVKLIGSAPNANQGPGDGPAGLPPASVFVETPRSVDSREIVTVTGSLRASARAEVAAREAGAILEVLVDEGDTVEESQPLARLDSRRTAALLAEAQAALTAASSLVKQRQAERDRARDDLSMKRGLFDRQAVSRSDILDAEQALAVTEAQYDAAREAVQETQSRLQFLEVQVEDMTIQAPFAGTVVSRQVEVGEWVDAGSVVVSLVQNDPVEAWLRVPVRYRNDVSQSPGDLRIQPSAGNQGPFTPSKVTVVPDVEPLSQLFTVVAFLDNPRGELTAGESITGLVPVGPLTPHWQISVDALIRTPTGDYLFLVDDNGQASRHPVTVAFERDGFAYLDPANDALSEGRPIVVEGNERLQPGQSLVTRARSPETDPAS